MSDDIGPLLSSWPYDEQADLMVRQVTTDDGEPRLQIRVELGLLEMQMEGRPDGASPGGHASLLDYYLDRLQSEAGNRRLQLSHEECSELHREAVQYYHRRVSFLKLGAFDAAAADAEHNLGVMDLLQDHAVDRNDWLHSERHRAFVLAHWARAKALSALDAGDRQGAVEAVDEGVRRIERLFRDSYQKPELIARSEELRSLQEFRAQVMIANTEVSYRPLDQLERLNHELQQAIEAEDFERAAELRDSIARLKGQGGV